MMFKLFVRACVLKTRHVTKLINYRHCHTHGRKFMLNVSVSQLKDIFKNHSLPIINGYACIIVDCPICSHVQKGSKLYINKKTGYFICDKCKYSGTWDVLQEVLLQQQSKEPKQFDRLTANLKTEDSFIETWEDIKKSSQEIMDLSAEEYRILLKNSSLPRVSQEEMCQLHCMYEKTSNTLHFPLLGLNNSIVGCTSLSIDTNEELTVPNFEVSGCIKYKQRNSKNDNVAVVVGMIDDLLALVSQKSANVIICLPYNLKCLPQQLLPYLESFKKLTLWFGNDDASWNTARQFGNKLNEKRCFFVKPIDSQPRPKLAVDMGYDLKKIVDSARPMWHKSIITFQQLREDVLSDLQNIDKVQGVKWNRYPSLNRILKGHRRGEFTVLTGPTGCGKTTFMSEYSIDLAMQGVNTLWGSFEISNGRLARTMLQQMVEVPLGENLDKYDEYADAFEKLPIYFMTFHGQQNINVVMDAVEHATYIYDITHVVIDNVQFMMGTSDDTKHGDRFWKQDDIVAKFRNFATTYNCHVTAIIHPRKERIDEQLTTSSIFGSAKAAQEADNVFIIQDKRLNSIRGKKYLQVTKNRYSGDLGIVVLDFDKTRLSYSPKIKSKNEDAVEEAEQSRKYT